MPRNKIEAEADRLFLIHLYRSAQGRIQVEEARRILNERRRAAAREVALALGRSAAEANTAAASAELSRATVARDVSAIQESLRDAIQAGAAGWLQRQLDDLERDYERTYELEGLALEELARSRRVSRQRRRGEPRERRGPVWQEVESFREDRAGNATWVRVIGDQLDRRQRLRQEQRSLLFGKAWLEQAGAAEAQVKASLQQILSGEEDPSLAAARVQALYDAEVQRVILDESMGLGPATPEFLQMEKLRVERNKRRFEAIQKWMGSGTKSAGRNGKAISVQFRVLPAGSEAN